jgi:serine/threonine-protein kinase
MSADKENEYFSDGLAEEILNLLAKIPGLKVIARTSAFAFKGQNTDIRKIAETLGVGNILEGSVRRSGNRIRVTAQLIHAADGSHLWSERYDRDMTDVFAVQDEVGQAISEALKVRLAPRTQTANIAAWQLFLKGRYHLYRYTPESAARARECFEQALAIDPDYAVGYSGLANYYYVVGVLELRPPLEVAPLCKSAAGKALMIDPGNSDAHSILGAMAGVFDFDWKSAETHFRKAMASEPIPPLVRFRYLNFYLLPRGRSAEAVEQSRLAIETDPVSVVLQFGLAWSLHFDRQYREAIERARRAMEIDAGFYLLWVVMGLACMQAGETQEAITSFKRAVELAPWHAMAAWLLAAAQYLSVDRERGIEYARKLAVPHGRTFGAAWYYAVTGEREAMFEAMDGAYGQRDLNLRFLGVDPVFDPYRADTRFQSILRRMNL